MKNKFKNFEHELGFWIATFYVLCFDIYAIPNYAQEFLLCLLMNNEIKVTPYN